MATAELKTLMERAYATLKSCERGISTMVDEASDNYRVRYNGRAFFIVARERLKGAKIICVSGDVVMQMFEYDMDDIERRRMLAAQQKALARSVVVAQPTSAAAAIPSLADMNVTQLLTHIISFSNSDPHLCLGLRKDQPVADAHKQFRQLSLRIHPDKLKNDMAKPAFQALQLAHQKIVQAAQKA